MLEFFNIDKDLKVYQDNEVYLFGASKAGSKVIEMIEGFFDGGEVKIKGFIDNAEKKCGKEFCGVKVISFSEFKEMYQKCSQHIIVQISSVFEKDISKQLEENGIYHYISYSEFCARFRTWGRYLASKENPQLKEWFYQCDWNNVVSHNMNMVRDLYFQRKGLLKLNSFDLMLSPPKVGNCTIRDSFAKQGKIIVDLWHTYKYLDEDIWSILKEEKIKLIIGVREPIGQNLSAMFEICENEFWDLDEFWEGGGDVQKIFDNYMLGKDNRKCWYNIFKEKMHYNFLVQDFFDQQLKPFWGIDIYETTFDQEKGYSAYQFGNIEIFIYQVEKLTEIFDKLASFLEMDHVQMKIANHADAKWYNRSYKDAINNITFSKDYFDGCYEGKYMRHFYSEKDIAAFKEKWRKNVS